MCLFFPVHECRPIRTTWTPGWVRSCRGMPRRSWSRLWMSRQRVRTEMEFLVISGWVRSCRGTPRSSWSKLWMSRQRVPVSTESVSLKFFEHYVRVKICDLLTIVYTNRFWNGSLFTVNGGNVFLLVPYIWLLLIGQGCVLSVLPRGQNFEQKVTTKISCQKKLLC
jgi:hypothetical protein